MEDGAAPRPERRWLTVMFCDLVGSTALGSRMDLEDFHDLMLDYQRACARRIEDAGGFVARFAGDGVLAYFGFPRALEDAAARAIHAALGLRSIGESLPRPFGRRLEVRVAVAAGEVIVGERVGHGGAAEWAIAGEAPNLAARLQQAARPGEVLVADEIKRRAEGLFTFRAPKTEPGARAGALAWRVLGERPTGDRFAERRAIGLSPFVDREEELASARSAWEAALGGTLAVLGFVGEPGIGKSRLLEECRRRIEPAAGGGWLALAGLAMHDNSPFHALRPVAERLGVGAPGDSQERETWLGEMRAGVARIAAEAPLVIAVEDMQWLDPSSLEFLDRLVGGAARNLLLIYTSRAPHLGRWPSAAHRSETILRPLAGAAGAALARSAAAGRLGLAELETVVARAAGVPLFIEELSRSLAASLEEGREARSPASLADLLAANLDRLGPLKRGAQLASVLGQTFAPEVLKTLLRAEGADPAATIPGLESAGILAVNEDGRRAPCAFRHALIAQAAHASLSRDDRRRLHGRAAALIEEDFPEIARAEPQIAARHWTLADQPERALAGWERAAALARRRRAFREAEHAFRQGLTILRDHPRLPDRDRRELALRAGFNRVLQVTHGYSAPESARSSRRNQALARRLGETEAAIREDLALWRGVFTEARYGAAERIVARAPALGKDEAAPLWLAAFQARAGIQQGFYTGRLVQAEDAFSAWRALAAEVPGGSGDDALSMGIGALIAWCAGRPNEAAARIDGAHDLARRRADPYDEVMALHCEACLRHFSADLEGLARAAATQLSLAKRGGFDYAAWLATGWGALVALEEGRAAEAIGAIDAALAGFDRLGARVSLVFWRGVLGRARAAAGDAAGALAAFAQALATNREERIFRIEPLLARARLYADLGQPEESLADIRAAVRLSSWMGAPAFRARALAMAAADRTSTP